MWEIDNISTKKRSLDFSSSGQGTFIGTAVYSDEQLVFNQIEAIENHGEDEQVFQAIICEHCGYTHCEPGNWIALRKAGEFYLFLPAFEWIIEEEESLKFEYLYTKRIWLPFSFIWDGILRNLFMVLILPAWMIWEE